MSLRLEWYLSLLRPSYQPCFCRHRGRRRQPRLSTGQSTSDLAPMDPCAVAIGSPMQEPSTPPARTGGNSAIRSAQVAARPGSSL